MHDEEEEEEWLWFPNDDFKLLELLDTSNSKVRHKNTQTCLITKINMDNS